MIGRLWAALAFVVIGLLGLEAAASCLPVASRPSLLHQASYGRFGPRGDIPENHVGVTFLGHASFLLETHQGVTAVTDYNDYHRPSRPPTIVTMNIAHSTHWTDAIEPEVKHILRGWDPKGGEAVHTVREKDMTVRNVVTNIRDWGGGTRRFGNSIFVFETAEMCLAHLGHLHHELSPVQLTELGKIDVLFVPVDGAYTLDQEAMSRVIGQIKPSLIIPMHYFGDATLNRFLGEFGSRYTVRRNDTPFTLLSRARLPRGGEILVLPGS